jgi:hypothetical protein
VALGKPRKTLSEKSVADHEASRTRFKRPRRPKPRAGANDAKMVPYPDIRDRFLARLEDDDASRLESYVAIGRFIVDRWLAEELTRPDGQQLDEQGCWELWDQCSEKHLRDLRTEAAQLLAKELRKGRLFAFVRDWGGRMEPLKSVFSVLSWVWWEALRGFVGAIGILLFGLAIVWLRPGIARSLRSLVNDSLPADTQPAFEEGNSQQKAHPAPAH